MLSNRFNKPIYGMALFPNGNRVADLDVTCRFALGSGLGIVGRRGFRSFDETVNLAALVSAAGALAAGRADGQRVPYHWHTQLRSAAVLQAALRDEHGASVLNMDPSLRSGIALVTPSSIDLRSPATLRSELHQQGLVASVFRDNVVRLALPEFFLPQLYLHCILRALWNVSRNKSSPATLVT